MPRLLSWPQRLVSGKVLSVADYLRRDWSHSRFEEVDFSQSRFQNVYFQDTVLRGAWLKRVEIDGYIDQLTINGIDVGPLIEAELDRRDPDRRLLRADDAESLRRAWEVVSHRWDETVQRARQLPEDLLHERVDSEWSFIETLRHLVFATDAWVLRVLLGEPAPFDPLGLAHTEMPPDTPGIPPATGARPQLDEVLAVRATRRAAVTRVLAGLSDERLNTWTEPVLESGYPESKPFLVRQCLVTVLKEEWLHREYAARDLAVLESR
ncbi:DinB family protein [Motilibacter sp. E257]|uniref:DinB family protein n=1 Tax=Motilibacter deserti TaxID=2714956 RepID=A0ABX0GZJ0_9ACTN|nr:DinB family protein [Motilibacter deserti]NHC15135.1 DinB family protein [Motilibacter deserti]